jgi:predicted transcriptional regulator
MKVDIKQAQKLREEGCTYKEIAQTLGCSEAWCKQNLKSVVKNSKDDEILTQAIELAQSTNGVTNIEIRKLIRTLYTNTYCKEDKQREDKIFNRIKSKLRKMDGCVVRPYWLQPQQASESFTALMQATKLISDRIEEEVAYFIHLFNLDSSYANSVRWAIVSLTYVGDKLGGGTDAQSTIDNLEHLVHILESRNKLLNDNSNTYVKKDILFDAYREKSIFCDFDIPEPLPLEAYDNE